MLNDEERLRVAAIVIETVGHRVPVVIGVSAITDRQAAPFARHARQIGADAVIAMPPYVRKAVPDELVEFYRAVAGAAELPVFIQNYSAPCRPAKSQTWMWRSGMRWRMATSRGRALHNRVMPLLNIEWMYGTAVYKEVLYRRGIIVSRTVRGPGSHGLDHFDQRELDAILVEVSELFTTAPLVAAAA